MRRDKTGGGIPPLHDGRPAGAGQNAKAGRHSGRNDHWLLSPIVESALHGTAARARNFVGKSQLGKKQFGSRGKRLGV
jgi:hypothetical protein